MTKSYLADLVLFKKKKKKKKHFSTYKNFYYINFSQT